MKYYHSLITNHRKYYNLLILIWNFILIRIIVYIHNYINKDKEYRNIKEIHQIHLGVIVIWMVMVISWRYHSNHQ